VTTKLEKLARRTALVAVAAATPLLVAVPAHADVPEGWDEPEAVDPLHALLVLGGIPLLLFVVITALVYVPSLMRGERGGAGGAHAIESHWFGGPRKGSRELESGSGSADASDSSGSGETGGASGRW
jgi:uncharacterized membrane protein YgcG